MFDFSGEKHEDARNVRWRGPMDRGPQSSDQGVTGGSGGETGRLVGAVFQHLMKKGRCSRDPS